jgi:hypothetical protein
MGDDIQDNFDLGDDFEIEKVSVNDNKKKRKPIFDQLKVKRQKHKTAEKSIDIMPSSEQQLQMIKSSFLESAPLQQLQASDFFNFCQNTTKSKYASAIASYIPKLMSKSKLKTKLPIAMVVCPSARRAASVINSISTVLKCKIGKLFTKHLKISEQVEILKMPVPIVVGTPHRMQQLIELGALKLQDLQLFLVDITFDSKCYNTLSLPDVSAEFLTLFTSHILPEKDHLKICLINDLTREEDSTKN